MSGPGGVSLSSVNSSGGTPSILDDPNLLAGLADTYIPPYTQQSSGVNTPGGPATQFTHEEFQDPKFMDVNRRNGTTDVGGTNSTGSTTINGVSGNDPMPGAVPGSVSTTTPVPSAGTTGTTGTAPTGATPAGTATTPSTSAKLQGRDPDLIYVGEKIKLPDGSTYTVRDGDTLSGIARDRGVTLAKLMELNGFNPKLLDDYANGKLVKAHHVGDLMPGSPGVTTVSGTPQVTPTSSTTTAPDSANSNSSSSTSVPQQNTGVLNSNQASSAGTSPKELLKNIDRITDAEDRQTLKGLLEILAKHDADQSAPMLTADQNLQWLDLVEEYGETFGLADASSTSVIAPEPTPPAPAISPPSKFGSTGMTQQLTA
jgi:LysM repeat protein